LIHFKTLRYHYKMSYLPSIYTSSQMIKTCKTKSDVEIFFFFVLRRRKKILALVNYLLHFLHTMKQQTNKEDQMKSK